MVIRNGQLTRSTKVEDQNPIPRLQKNSTRTEKSKGLAFIPYVEGLSERVARVFCKHGISTAVKPHRTLHSVLVHPKDKVLPHEKK